MPPLNKSIKRSHSEARTAVNARCKRSGLIQKMTLNGSRNSTPLDVTVPTDTNGVSQRIKYYPHNCCIYPNYCTNCK